jgi:ubiquinone/menaquinone biosynthesis C-methylase UbiE
MNVDNEAKELRKLWGSFWQARVLLTANSLRIFDHLSTVKSAAEVAGLIKADARATEILLDAVASLGLIKKSGEKYRNSAAARNLLVSGAPHYQGDIINHADNLWINWSHLDEIVKTGLPARRSFGSEAFIRGMHNIAVMKAADVINNIDLKGVRKALDLGGGPGTYSMELARRIDSVTLFDLPQTIAIAKDITGKTMLDNISFIEGDFLADDIGSGYDLIFISQVFHAFSGSKNLNTLKKVFNALNPNGLVVIQEFYLGKDRASPPRGALFSVNMLVNTHGGRCYTVPEMKGWLSSTGFSKIKHKISEDDVLVSGRKSGS